MLTFYRHTGSLHNEIPDTAIYHWALTQLEKVFKKKQLRLTKL